MLISSLSRRILRELCTNSRITITELSKKLGVSRPIISKHIKSLENELGLQYTLDLNYNALGFTKMYLYSINFTKRPDNSVLVKFLAGSDSILLGAKTSGDFDLIMFVIAGAGEEYAKWHLSMALELSEYGASIDKADIDILHYGFVQLGNRLIETATLDDVYKKLLVELNQNSRATIKALAERLKMNEDMVSYYMAKLIKTGAIRRFAAIITKPPRCTSVMFFMKYTYRLGHIQRIYEKRKIYFRKEAELPVYNEHQMVASISGSGDEFIWAMADTKEQAIEDRVKLHERMFRKDTPKIRVGIVEAVLKGDLAIRNLDMKQGYRTTQWGPDGNYTGD